MKPAFFISAVLFSLSLFSQSTYKNLPVIKSFQNKADYRVDTNWTRGNWNIAPEASPDILSIPCFSKTVEFGFYTDIDSIVFPLSGSKAVQFYVLTKEGKYALTEIVGYDYKALQFDATPNRATYSFWYESNKDNDYLRRLKSLYPIDSIVKGVSSDSARALRVLKWVHDQWKHDGNNEPKKKDAISILQEVKEGKHFRCVEYGIVTTAALNAIGMPARVLALKTKDVETTASGAGHVLLEVFLPDMNKWVMMDGQWDVMPVLNGRALNAVEFQQAIANHYDKLQLRSLSGTKKAAYIQWIYPYLYYFDISFDNREGADRKKEVQNGKSALMLVPVGAKHPVVFQQKWPISNVLYTNSLADFYAPPVVGN